MRLTRRQLGQLSDQAPWFHRLITEPPQPRSTESEGIQLVTAGGMRITVYRDGESLEICTENGRTTMTAEEAESISDALAAAVTIARNARAQRESS